MVNIGDFFGGGNWAATAQLVLWGAVAIFIGLLLGGILYFVIIKSAQKRIIEINIANGRMKFLTASEKRNRSHKKQLFIGSKINKFVPNVQQEDIYLQGQKENIILLKDNNGLHHTLRIPRTQEELANWYKAQGIDVEEELNRIKEADTPEKKLNLIDKIKDMSMGIKRKGVLHTISHIYLLPNPLENLEWLADEQNQSTQLFGTGLMKNPMLVLFGTFFLCGMIFIISLVVTKMM